MNISLLPYPFDILKYLLENCKSKPKVIGISECRIKVNRTLLSNINLKDYTYEWTHTEASKGGTFTYIDNKLKYKIWNDLKLYKEKQINLLFLQL